MVAYVFVSVHVCFAARGSRCIRASVVQCTKNVGRLLASVT